MTDELFGMIKIFSGRGNSPTVRVSAFAIAALLAFFAADFSAWTLLCVSAAFLHEAAHIAAAFLCRERIDTVNIYPFGAEIRIGGGISSYKKDLIVSSAGIALNLLLFLAFFSSQSVHLKFFAAANLVLAAVNIIPARGLDGGRMAEDILFTALDYTLASSIYLWLTYAAMGVLVTAAVGAVVVSGGNVSAAFVCAYMLIAVYVKDKCGVGT